MFSRRKKVIENQTNHVVAVGSTATSRSRIIIYYVITVVENNKDIMKITVHGELNTRKKISYFTFHGKKIWPIKSHENTLYHLLLLLVLASYVRPFLLHRLLLGNLPRLRILHLLVDLNVGFYKFFILKEGYLCSNASWLHLF